MFICFTLSFTHLEINMIARRSGGSHEKFLQENTRGVSCFFFFCGISEAYKSSRPSRYTREIISLERVSRQSPPLFFGAEVLVVFLFLSFIAPPRPRPPAPRSNQSRKESTFLFLASSVCGVRAWPARIKLKSMCKLGPARRRLRCVVVWWGSEREGGARAALSSLSSGPSLSASAFFVGRRAAISNK